MNFNCIHLLYTICNVSFKTIKFQPDVLSNFSSILFTDFFLTQARDIITEGKGQMLDQTWHNDIRVEKTDHGSFDLLDTTLVGKASCDKKAY